MGMETWLFNGSKFVGNFRNGKKYGHGRFQWEDGSFYEGSFKEGLYEGKGTYYYADLQKTYDG